MLELSRNKKSQSKLISQYSVIILFPRCGRKQIVERNEGATTRMTVNMVWLNMKRGQGNRMAKNGKRQIVIVWNVGQQHLTNVALPHIKRLEWKSRISDGRENLLQHCQKSCRFHVWNVDLVLVLGQLAVKHCMEHWAAHSQNILSGGGERTS